MTTEIRGTLIALGTPPASLAGDNFPPPARALVRVTTEAIRALEPNLLYREVAIISAEELDALRADIDRLAGYP